MTHDNTAQQPGTATEHPNVAAIRNGFTKVQTEGDITALVSLFAPTMTFTCPGNNPLSGTYEGRDGVMAFFGAEYERSNGTLRGTLIDVIGDADHTFTRIRLHGERNGLHLDAQSCFVHQFDAEGHITAVFQFNYDQAATDAFWN